MKVHEYLENTNENLTVVLQIEHIDGVRNIESIVAVPGFDAVFIGPYDLSGSMGMTGMIDAPEVQREIEVVRRACSKAGLAVGIFAADVNTVFLHSPNLSFSFFCSWFPFLATIFGCKTLFQNNTEILHY